MNLTVRFVEQFSETSPYLLGSRAQLSSYTSETQKTFDISYCTVHLSLSRSSPGDDCQGVEAPQCLVYDHIQILHLLDGGVLGHLAALALLVGPVHLLPEPLLGCNSIDIMNSGHKAEHETGTT